MPKKAQVTGKAAMQKSKHSEVKNIGKKIESHQDKWEAGCQRRGKEHGCPQ